MDVSLLVCLLLAFIVVFKFSKNMTAIKEYYLFMVVYPPPLHTHTFPCTHTHKDKFEETKKKKKNKKRKGYKKE